MAPQGVTIEAWFPPIKRKLVFSTSGHDNINLADIMRQQELPEPDPLLTYPPSPHIHSGSDLLGVVRTINGESPDFAGNIVVTGTGGGTGQDGADGRGISSVTKTSTSGLIDTYTITYTDNTTSTFSLTNGSNGTSGTNGVNGINGANGANGIDGINGTDGADGHSPVITWSGTTIYVDGVAGPNLKGATGADSTVPGPAGADGQNGVGIATVALTDTSGLVDTYTITLTDSTTTTFTVTNGENGLAGADGSAPVITWQGTTIYVDGVAGPDLKGATGAQGADGGVGATGASAYQVWLAAGNTGTESEFIASLKGETGGTGLQGPPGADATLILPPADGKIYVMRNQQWEELEIS